MSDLSQVDVPDHEPRPQKLGRPKIDPAERRTIPLRLFQNESEYLKLREDAASTGMSIHDYVRALIAEHKPAIRGGGRGVDPRLLYELNAIGNNLNQAVARMNAGSTKRHDWDALRLLLQDVILKVALCEEDDVH